MKPDSIWSPFVVPFNPMHTIDRTAAFARLHQPGTPLIMPNPWDPGSARILEGLGFKALATSSAGFALTKGRRDYRVTRQEALAHCRDVVEAVDLPVSADLENGFGHGPEDAAETIRLAANTGLSGGSIEDASGDESAPIYPLSQAVDRVTAAVEAARNTGTGFVLTARAEGFLHGETDLDAVIERLQAFESAGADVLYAPGLPDLEAVRAVCAAVAKPVNVLVLGRLARHSVTDFAQAGAARLSIGGAFAYSAYATLAAATTILTDGDFSSLASRREEMKHIPKYLGA